MLNKSSGGRDGVNYHHMPLHIWIKVLVQVQVQDPEALEAACLHSI